MMSAQMLAAATQSSGTVADLAPGAKDGMRMLEAKAAEMAVEPAGNYFILVATLYLEFFKKNSGLCKIRSSVN